jgi:hypothetical protein
LIQDNRAQVEENMAGYRAEYEERAEARYLLSAPPVVVAKWLKTNWKQPEAGIDSDGWRTDDNVTRWRSMSSGGRSLPTSGHGRLTGTRLEQAWFPGVHSNIGGGYAPDGLANEALHWIVGKAESLALEFDSAYLAHFLPCFNSVLNNSMTLLYRAMRPYTRRLGDHTAAGEAVHQATLDRKKLAECHYHPANLNAALPTVSTTRIARGTPCSNVGAPVAVVNRSGTSVTT